MARRPRQRQEREVRAIEIKRNVIEQFLMDAKDYITHNRKLVLYSLVVFIGAVLIAGFTATALVWVNSGNEQRFNEIIDRMAKIKGPAEKNNMDVVVVDLKKFIDSTYFGFPHNAACYVLGNIYYDRKNWADAKEFLLRYADKEKKSVLAPIALLKAALAMEEANDLKGALDLYRRMEETYPDSVIADQVYYNYGRVCGMNRDLVNSRIYYNKVIATFPESAYAKQAKKRLFLLGAM